jgi:adenosine deaminase/aminodeoxyfutalosine deaminase
LAAEEFGFSRDQLREIARNSFEASFLPVEKKLRFLHQVDTLA